MKKTFASIKTIIMAVIALTAMTACDRDTELAYELDGVWQGSIIGNYYLDRYHESTISYDTEIMFRRNSWDIGGTGYEIDREVGTRRMYRNEFNWSIRNGLIYLDYDDGYRIIIRDYETYLMNGIWRFRGYFDDYDTGEQLASFTLLKVSDPRNYYEYGIDTDYYYAPKKSTAEGQ